MNFTLHKHLNHSATALAAALALTVLWATSANAEPLRADQVQAVIERTAPKLSSSYQRCDAAVQAQAFARTELFFGLSRPGGVVTETEFQAFVDTQVTPRFPDGLTVLSGAGQFRDASGKVVVEGSKLLVLLVPQRDREASTKVEQVRSAYKKQFQQESVLRTDETSCVSF